MKKRAGIVFVRWDAEGGVWVAKSKDIGGLTVSAASEDRIIEKIKLVAPDLIQANDLLISADRFAIYFIKYTEIRV